MTIANKSTWVNWMCKHYSVILYGKQFGAECALGRRASTLCHSESRKCPDYISSENREVKEWS